MTVSSSELYSTTRIVVEKSALVSSFLSVEQTVFSSRFHEPSVTR